MCCSAEIVSPSSLGMRRRKCKIRLLFCSNSYFWLLSLHTYYCYYIYFNTQEERLLGEGLTNVLGKRNAILGKRRLGLVECKLPQIQLS